MISDQPLAGRVVGITAERRAEDQALLFRRLGADVVLAPTMHTRPLADPDGLRRVTVQLIDEPPDFLVANTGMGIRTWMEAAAEWGMQGALVDSFRRSKVAARGPKAAGAISSSKLKVWWRSPTEQLTEVAGHLVETGVAGKRIAFQLHGDEQAGFVSGLEAAGATVIPVPVYEWSVPAGHGADAALALIERSCAGEIDAITFTAGPQVRNLFVIAEEHGHSTKLAEAFGQMRPVAGCIGPVCASVARDEGIIDPVVPDNWRLGSLVKTVAASLQGS
ncbi:MAG TPA: uroporphyrinogen-III synthase [Acidimicrobiales bacterium]|nr:uroporphyrinogen-III synthase [Acidimicrobiales bacterium]